MPKRKYVLYLEWIEAEKFYYQYRNNIQIEYCIADLKGVYSLKIFHNIPVLELDVSKIKKNNELIIVCTEKYSEIKEEFLCMGLCEFRHFIPSDLLDRKMVIMHGNCYMNSLREYLMKIPEFKEKYYIYSIPPICYNYEHEISEELLQMCDIFIHQNIHTKAYGEKLTDEWIIPKLPQQCHKISIPNFMGIYRGGVFFYPQCIGAGSRRRLIIQNYNFFARTDYHIEDCYQSGMSEEEIARRIKSVEVFDKKFIKDVFNNSRADLLKREQEWDVKISDYFEETYRLRHFFWDPGHPADHVIKEIAIRIAKRLEISIDRTSIKDLGKETFNAGEIPIYQCVKDILHLGWKDDCELREGSSYKLTSRQMDIDEYVKEYIYFMKYAEHCDQYNKGILAELKDKGRLVAFGAGHLFDDYMKYYGAEYAPDLVVDNDVRKWGNETYGLTIENPQKIQNGDGIIICCCGAEEDIGRQILEMEIGEVALYRPDNFIERKGLKDS